MRNHIKYIQYKKRNQLNTKLNFINLMSLKTYKTNALPYSYYIRTKKFSQDMIMIIFEILSRKVFIYALTEAETESKLKCYKSFVSTHKIASMHDDSYGYNDSNEFIEYNKTNKIKLTLCDYIRQYVRPKLKSVPLTKEVGNKALIADNVINALISLINKHKTTKSDDALTTWIDEIADQYNSAPHSSLKKKGEKIKLTPNEAYEDEPFLTDLYNKNKQYNDDLAKILNAGFSPGVKVNVVLSDQSHKPGDTREYSKKVHVVLKEHNYGLLLREPSGETIKVMGRNMKLAAATT